MRIVLRQGLRSLGHVGGLRAWLFDLVIPHLTVTVDDPVHESDLDM